MLFLVTFVTKARNITDFMLKKLYVNKIMSKSFQSKCLLNSKQRN